MGLVGVHQAAPGSTDWVWLCACGASGDGADREKAREQYRTHRSTCGQIPQLEVQVPTATKKTAAKKTAVAKKTTAVKKTATKEKAKRVVLLAVDDPRLAEVVKRMKAGSGLIEEARRLGFTHNGPLRAVLPKFVGGKKQYQELMAAARKNAAPAEKKVKPAAKKKATPAKANPAPAEPSATPPVAQEGATS